MNHFNHVTGFILVILCMFPLKLEAKGFTYSATVRNSEGQVLPNVNVRLFLEIANSPASESNLYEEHHETESDSNGLISILVGEGNDPSTDFESINWTKDLYLKVNASINGGAMQLLGITSILGAPTALQVQTASNLIKTSADGSQWRLHVNNAGNVYWHKIVSSPNDEQETTYDVEKIPETLYLQGNMVNNWDSASGIPFTKVSFGKFTLTQYLEKGNIFKFTSLQSWEAPVDWSGTSSQVGIASPLKEWGDTPVFEGENGYYTLIVDFNSFTLTINKQ